MPCLADAHVFVPARARDREQIARGFHARRERVLDVGRIANVDVVVDDDHQIEILERAEGGQDRVALQAVVLRSRFADLDDGVEAVQPAGRHLGVDHDRNGAVSTFNRLASSTYFRSITVSRP